MTLRLQHHFTLNPDGSGKCRVRWSGPDGAQAPQIDEFRATEIHHAQGVDSWRDVTCGVVDAEVVFTGTAYFSDISKLHLHCQGFRLHALDLTLSATTDGPVTLATRVHNRTPSVQLPADVDAEQLAELMSRERDKLAQGREFLANVFGAIDCHITIDLPAAIASHHACRRSAPNQVVVQMRGSDLLAAIDRLLQDDAALRRVLEQGGASPETVSAMVGEGGPFAVATQPGARAAFDYAAEVAQARVEFAAQCRAHGWPTPPRVVAPLANLRAIAVKHVIEVDAARELTPGQNYPSSCFTLAGEFAAPVLGVEHAVLDDLRSDDGRDLLAGEGQRRIYMTQLSSDKRTVWFDVEASGELQPPIGLREARGTLHTRIGVGSREVDLGITELTEGNHGSELGARVLRCEPFGDDQWTLALGLQTPREAVLGVTLWTEDGCLELRYGGYSSSSDECSLDFTVPGQIPTQARLSVTVPESIDSELVPFRLGPIDALGRAAPSRE